MLQACCKVLAKSLRNRDQSCNLSQCCNLRHDGMPGECWVLKPAGMMRTAAMSNFTCCKIPAIRDELVRPSCCSCPHACTNMTYLALSAAIRARTRLTLSAKGTTWGASSSRLARAAGVPALHPALLINPSITQSHSSSVALGVFKETFEVAAQLGATSPGESWRDVIQDPLLIAEPRVSYRFHMLVSQYCIVPCLWPSTTSVAPQQCLPRLLPHNCKVHVQQLKPAHAGSGAPAATAKIPRLHC